LTVRRASGTLDVVLVPSDDPPFVEVCFDDAPRGIALRHRDGRELVRRLEERGDGAPLVARIFAARQSPFPQRFVPTPEEESLLLAALDVPPDVGGRLADLRTAVAARRV
jgi:hypothetical protein